jgi:hypothetical protein
VPPTDYTDPETPFPRLEVRIQKLESDAYWVQIWLWETIGSRRQIMNRKGAGSFPDSHEVIQACAQKHHAEWGPDDVTIRIAQPKKSI